MKVCKRLLIGLLILFYVGIVQANVVQFLVCKFKDYPGAKDLLVMQLYSDGTAFMMNLDDREVFKEVPRANFSTLDSRLTQLTFNGKITDLGNSEKLDKTWQLSLDNHRDINQTQQVWSMAATDTPGAAVKLICDNQPPQSGDSGNSSSSSSSGKPVVTEKGTLYFVVPPAIAPAPVPIVRMEWETTQHGSGKDPLITVKVVTKISRSGQIIDNREIEFNNRVTARLPPVDVNGNLAFFAVQKGLKIDGGISYQITIDRDRVEPRAVAVALLADGQQSFTNVDIKVYKIERIGVRAPYYNDQSLFEVYEKKLPPSR